MKWRGSRGLTLGNSGSGLWALEPGVAIRSSANISINDARHKGSVTCRVGGARSDDPILPICITNHVRHLHDTFATIWDDSHSRMTKDDKGWRFVTICNVLYHSTILYSAPFHFCDLF